MRADQRRAAAAVPAGSSTPAATSPASSTSAAAGCTATAMTTAVSPVMSAEVAGSRQRTSRSWTASVSSTMRLSRSAPPCRGALGGMSEW
ncbi:hypothetical protein [Nonomuraea dietziae]|uniref:hypothetical protein n=1 Tax=Nonomuraea dietziae TaxID=65515 RepID=UPI0031D4C9EA